MIEKYTDGILRENKGPIKAFVEKADLPAIEVALLEELSTVKPTALVNENGPLVAYGEMCGIIRTFKRLREVSREVTPPKQKTTTKDPDME